MLMKVLGYGNKCMISRLQERVDVNWLPDQLLLIILSNLSLDDIISCQQVNTSSSGQSYLFEDS